MKIIINPFNNIYFNSNVILVIRLGIVYLTSVTTYNTLKYDGGIKSLYYATNWGQILVTLFYWCCFFHSLFSVTCGSWLTEITAILMHGAASLEFLIFTFYWPILSYNDLFDIFTNYESALSHYYFKNSIMKHLMNPIIIWIPLLMNRTELKSSNFYFVVLLSVSYLFTNYYVTTTTGKPVYSVLDWNSKTSHCYSAIAFSLLLTGYKIALSISEALSEKCGFSSKRITSKTLTKFSLIKDN